MPSAFGGTAQRPITSFDSVAPPPSHRRHWRALTLERWSSINFSERLRSGEKASFEQGCLDKA